MNKVMIAQLEAFHCTEERSSVQKAGSPIEHAEVPALII
jgi:hypothetical protein